jgi:hypothetical protein
MSRCSVKYPPENCTDSRPGTTVILRHERRGRSCGYARPETGYTAASGGLCRGALGIFRQAESQGFLREVALPAEYYDVLNDQFVT